MFQFKTFLLNESKLYLGEKLGDILTALQTLQEDSVNMGSREIIRATESIVNQIRKILHGKWTDGEINSLKKLQKVGVALARAIEEDQDNLKGMIVSAVNELQDLSNEMETPVNNIGVEGEQEKLDEPLGRGSQIGA